MEEILDLVNKLNDATVSRLGCGVFWMETDGDHHAIEFSPPDQGGRITLWDSEEDDPNEAPASMELIRDRLDETARGIHRVAGSVRLEMDYLAAMPGEEDHAY